MRPSYGAPFGLAILPLPKPWAQASLPIGRKAVLLHRPALESHGSRHGLLVSPQETHQKLDGIFVEIVYT